MTLFAPIAAEASSQGVNRQLQQQTVALAALTELAAAAAGADSLKQAWQVLVDQARKFTGCQMVALAEVSEAGTCRLRAISATTTINRSTELAQRLEAAMQEARPSRVPIYLRAEELPEALPVAHRRLAEFASVNQLATAALRDQRGNVVAVWTFLGEPRDCEEQSLAGWMAAGSAILGNLVPLLGKAHESSGVRQLRRSADLVRSRWVWLVPLLLTTVIGLGLFIRLPYRVTAPCVLQPETRRYVGSPFNGLLERSLVKPGELVKKGQVLARMEGRELQSELASTVAEYERAAKDRDVNLVAGKVALAQMAALEMERSQQRRKLLQSRIQQLEIKCPLDGIVISGDLQRSEGVAVTVGQPLFEIAPLDRLVCELEVPDGEISHVSAGQSVSISLEAFGGQRWNTELADIHPRAEIRDNRNIFVAEIWMENSKARLRPGMKGQATVSTDSQSLAWIILHKPWRWLATRMGW